MPVDLPRVTYSNIGEDFSPVHAYLDRQILGFEVDVLGQNWTTPFATGPAVSLASPVDDALWLGRFPISTADDIKGATASAKQAAKRWNHASLEDRLEFAARWKAVLNDSKYDLGLAALYEVGKSRLEAIGETEECVDMVDYYAAQLRENDGFDRPMTELVAHETARSVMKPYGVFAVIAPFNFPVALSVGMLCGALLAGNSVVYKPAPGCALTGLMLAKTLRAAGLPEGVFNIVLGGGDVGQMLSTDTNIDGVAFTGSHATGMGIFRHMAQGPWMKPVVAEMGGKNPAYVTAQADLERAAQGVARSAFGLQGQKCSACSVVYVENAVKEAFLTALVAFTAKLTVGDPRQGDTYMGPLYNDATLQRFTDALAEPGTLLRYGGTATGGRNARYVLPAIVEVDAPGRLTQDELFMPFLAVRGVDTLKDALREGNDVAYGLTAGIYTRDEAELQYFLAHAQAGVLYANRASGATTGAWPGAQPFCGWKGTGVSGKGGLGPYFLPQFMREQSQTIMTI